MSIKNRLGSYVSKGFTLAQARSFVAQEIILSKIEKSKYIDKVLLKGGVVMYNITKEKRRSTLDLDLDFVRINIQDDENIRSFINALNKKDSEYQIEIIDSIQELHHQDYHGKRVKLKINDGKDSIKFKLDIGVHTLLAINQDSMCFNFEHSKNLTLLVNPPEQIFAEKLFALAKLGPASERFKDLDDMFYLTNNISLDLGVVRQCLSILTRNNPYGLKDTIDVIDNAMDCLNSSFFENSYNKNKGSWLGIEFSSIKHRILSFINKL